MLPKGWIELTQPNNKTVTVSVAQIVCVRLPVPNEFPPAVQSAVDFTNGKSQAVTEAVGTIMQKIIDNPPPSS